MARKVIDTGAVGNDGTGDSIRDSFSKVNDNFRELYSSLGLGERLTFLGLDDTPSNFIGQEAAVFLEPTLVANLHQPVVVALVGCEGLACARPVARGVHVRRAQTTALLPLNLVVVGVGIPVVARIAELNEIARREHTRTVVVAGVRIVIQGVHVRASRSRAVVSKHRQKVEEVRRVDNSVTRQIPHTVFAGDEQALLQDGVPVHPLRAGNAPGLAIVVDNGVDARVVVNRCRDVVVAGVGVGAAGEQGLGVELGNSSNQRWQRKREKQQETLAQEGPTHDNLVYVQQRQSK